MSVPVPKFVKGQKVWDSWPVSRNKALQCPDCFGAHKWKAISPAGQEYEMNCPRCASSYHSYGQISLTYSEYVAASRMLTIGSIRIDTESDHPVSYMCVETGVGSGTIHYEEHLFATEAEALAHSANRAIEQNQANPHQVERFKGILKVSDYQLSNALMESALELQAKAQRAMAQVPKRRKARAN